MTRSGPRMPAKGFGRILRTRGASIATAALIASCALGCVDEDAIVQRAGDECQAVVDDALASCSADAWELCSVAYSRVVDDMQEQIDRMHADMVAALSQRAQDWLVGIGCVWVPTIKVWSCQDWPGPE